MRIIFLNSWYAKAGKAFFDFILKYSAGTDIFCLNEINPEVFATLQEKLPDFRSYYEKSIMDRTMGLVYGQAIFTRKDISIEILTRIVSFRNVYNDIGFATPFKVHIKNKTFYVINVHGKARPGHKLDTHARIR